MQLHLDSSVHGMSLTVGKADRQLSRTTFGVCVDNALVEGLNIPEVEGEHFILVSTLHLSQVGEIFR